jgi:CheY-like chemotaxis protein
MRILVVEDEPVAAAVLSKGLREHAYAVDVAADGSTALEQASISDYDLIVLDVLMPGMNGLEVCRRWRMVRVQLERAPGGDTPSQSATVVQASLLTHSLTSSSVSIEPMPRGRGERIRTTGQVSVSPWGAGSQSRTAATSRWRGRPRPGTTFTAFFPVPS